MGARGAPCPGARAGCSRTGGSVPRRSWHPNTTVPTRPASPNAGVRPAPWSPRRPTASPRRSGARSRTMTPAAPADRRAATPRRSARGVPRRTTASATSTATRRWRPVPKNGAADPASEAVAPRAPAEVVEVVEVGVLGEGRPDAAGEHGHLGRLGGLWMTMADGHGIGGVEALVDRREKYSTAGRSPAPAGGGPRHRAAVGGGPSLALHLDLRAAGRSNARPRSPPGPGAGHRRPGPPAISPRANSAAWGRTRTRWKRV